MGEKTAIDPPEKVPTTEKEIERIGDIIKNARGTWFVLLGSLVFAAITLASVKDASFFITSEQTKLPLLGISVPITSFFWAGALLVTALYTYLHLYLVQLWDALGEADARIGDKPLADVIHPWLVSDAALRVRDKRRGAKRYNPYARKPGWKNRLLQFEWWLVTRIRKCWLGYKYRWLLGRRRFGFDKRSFHHRWMNRIGSAVSVALVWGFGLVVIGWFWWRSMPAHDIWLTGWLAALLVWSLFIFGLSGFYALERLGQYRARFPAIVWFGVLALTIVGLTIVRTHYDRGEGYPRINRSQLAEGCTDHQKDTQKRTWCPYLLNFAQEFIRPARAEMPEVVFTQKPAGWTGFDLAKQEFRLRWCKQLKGKACKINPLNETEQFEEKEEEKFEKAWKRQQEATLATFSKPDLRGKRLEGADLRFAELEGVKLAEARLQGADLSFAKMQDADLEDAEMQGADLEDAEMQGAVLTRAQMQGADLSFAKMQGAVLTRAQMQGADLRFAEMQGADLRLAEMQGAVLEGAKMQGAVLEGAEMQGADLEDAEMQGADLSFAKMQDADLSFAKMQGADLEDAEMQGADLSFAKMQGTPEKVMKLKSTNLSEGNFSVVSLRFVDFTGADVTKIRNLETSFGDGSVNLAGELKTPEGWCEAVLSDAQYWGRYQGWLQKFDLGEIYDDEIDKYPLIRFSEPCPE